MKPAANTVRVEVKRRRGAVLARRTVPARRREPTTAELIAAVFG